MPKEMLHYQYQKVLSKVLKLARENSGILGNSPYLNLESLCIDEQDNDYVFYGIRKDEKGKLIFCESSGHSNSRKGEQIDIGTLANRLANYAGNYSITPEEIGMNFRESMKEYFRASEIKRAGVALKVHRKVRGLDEALKG